MVLHTENILLPNSMYTEAGRCDGFRLCFYQNHTGHKEHQHQQQLQDRLCHCCWRIWSSPASRCCTHAELQRRPPWWGSSRPRPASPRTRKGWWSRTGKWSWSRPRNGSLLYRETHHLQTASPAQETNGSSGGNTAISRPPLWQRTRWLSNTLWRESGFLHEED